MKNAVAQMQYRLAVDAQVCTKNPPALASATASRYWGWQRRVHWWPSSSAQFRQPCGQPHTHNTGKPISYLPVISTLPIVNSSEKSAKLQLFWRINWSSICRNLRVRVSSCLFIDIFQLHLTFKTYVMDIISIVLIVIISIAFPFFH